MNRTQYPTTVNPRKMEEEERETMPSDDEGQYPDEEIDVLDDEPEGVDKQNVDKQEELSHPAAQDVRREHEDEPEKLRSNA